MDEFCFAHETWFELYSKEYNAHYGSFFRKPYWEIVAGGDEECETAVVLPKGWKYVDSGGSLDDLDEAWSSGYDDD